MRGLSMKKTAFTILALTLLSTMVIAGSATSAPLPQTIFIHSDGSVDPGTAPIQRIGNTYTFTDDAYATIVVQKGSIVIDGAGHTLSGPYNGSEADLWVIGQGPDQDANGTYTVGIDAGGKTVSNLTIMNLNVKNFTIGTYLWTANNTLAGNAFVENAVGILLSGPNSTITGNYIARNENGLFFGVNEPGSIALNITLSRNCFLANGQQLSGCVCKEYNAIQDMHTWDDGKQGNFWSDYNGTDSNGDGVGDQPYVIDAKDHDRYPLMQNPVSPPSVASRLPVEALILPLALVLVIVAAVIVLRRRKRRG